MHLRKKKITVLNQILPIGKLIFHLNIFKCFYYNIFIYSLEPLEEVTNSKELNLGDEAISFSTINNESGYLSRIDSGNFSDSKENLKITEQNTNNLYINIKRNPEDSGLYSAEHFKKESGSSDSSGEFFLSEDMNNLDRSPAPEVVELTENNKPPRNVSPGTSHVCVKLCHLIKAFRKFLISKTAS